MGKERLEQVSQRRSTKETRGKDETDVAKAPGRLTARGRVGRFASFIAFFSTLLVYSPNMMALRGADSGNLTGFFAEPLLSAVFFCSLAFAIFAARLIAAPSQTRGCHWRRQHTLAAMALYLAGGTTFSLVLLFQPVGVSPALCVAAALVQSLALIPVCVAWGTSLSDLDLAHALLLVALTSAASAGCNVALRAFGSPANQLAFPLLMLCGLAWPAWMSFRNGTGLGAARQVGRPLDNDRGRILADSPADTIANDIAGKPRIVLAEEPADSRDDGSARNSVVTPGDISSVASRFLSVMGVPLLGMAISSFAMGVQPGFLFDATVDAQHLGVIVGAACLLPLALVRTMRGPRPIFVLAYQLYLPVCAAVAVVLCSFPVGGFAHECGLAATYAFYAMVSAVGVAAGIAASNTGEFPRTLMLSSLVGVFCGAGILGVALGARFDALVDNRREVLAVLTAAYGCCLMLAGCARSWQLTVEPPVAAGSMTDPLSDRHVTGTGTTDAGRRGGHRRDDLEARLAELAEQGRLSPRESEVLGFVGRGHGSVYAAKTLLVSESTVYTHVRSIYRKLGVTSREELLSLLEGKQAHAHDNGADRKATTGGARGRSR